MTLQTLLAWWPATGHGRFLWGAYGVSLLLLAVETALVLMRHRRVTAQARAARAEAP